MCESTLKPLNFYMDRFELLKERIKHMSKYECRNKSVDFLNYFFCNLIRKVQINRTDNFR